MPVFMGLIGDLFPALDVPRKRDLDFEKKLVDGAISMKLQPEPGFILKVYSITSTVRIYSFSYYYIIFKNYFSVSDGTISGTICGPTFSIYQWICRYREIYGVAMSP